MLITEKTTNYIQHNGLALVLGRTKGTPLIPWVANKVITYVQHAFPNTGTVHIEQKPDITHLDHCSQRSDS